MIGLTLDEALADLLERGFYGVPHDPSAAPPDVLGHAVVTDQSPEPGARAHAGSRVRLWVERGGDAASREPGGASQRLAATDA